MTSLFKQLEALAVTPNKAHTRFRRTYAANEHYNQVVVAESWAYLLRLDATLAQCEGLFRRCLSDPGAAAVAAMAARSARSEENRSDRGGDAGAAADAERAWESKDIEFMVEAELRECERVLQLFLDLSTPWLLHEPCQRLVDFLIYQYELATRFGEMLLLALLPIHETAYFVKTGDLITLPAGSDFAYYLPPRPADAKASKTAPDERTVSRETIIAGTVRSFSNYRRISETVERLALVHQRGGTYVPLYTVLSVAFVEHNRGKLDDGEVRLLLNNVFSGLKHPESSAYYSAQLCTLAVMFTTVQLMIPVQRSVVTAMLNPLLSELCAAAVPPFELRLKLKDSLLVLLGMLHQQKERLDVLPVNTTHLLLTAFRKFPALVNVFRGIGGSGEALDFSRLCKLLTVSVVKACKKDPAKGAENASTNDTVDLIKTVVTFFGRLDYSIMYLRLMLYALVDDLVMFCLSSNQGEMLFQWDSETMKGIVNANHSATLGIYCEFFTQLHSASQSVFEDVLRRTMQSANCAPELMSAFLFICYSVSRGCPLHFTVMVHKCLGRKLDPDVAALTKSAAAGNMASTLLLFTDSSLPSKARAQLYSMLSAGIDAEVVSSMEHGALSELVRVSLEDPECFSLFCNDTRLLNLLPPAVVSEVLTAHIGALLTGSGLSFSIPVSLKVKSKSTVLEMGAFYDKCYEILHRDSAVSRRLLSCLSLFSDSYGRASGAERDLMHRISRHFMSLLRTVNKSHKPSKAGKKKGKKADSNAVSSDNPGSSSAPPVTGGPDSPERPAAEAAGTASSGRTLSLARVCEGYFGDSPVEDGVDFQSTMSLLLSVLDSMVQLSTATTYVNTATAEDSVSDSSSNSIALGKDYAWFNEWLVCYALFRSSELLRASSKAVEGHAEEGEDRSPVSMAVCTSLSSDQQCHLFSLSEVVLCYALKLYRGSVLLGELTFGFARCHFKLLTMFSLSAPRKGDSDFIPANQASEVTTTSVQTTPTVDPDTALDRDSLFLHTMLTLSSEEFTSMFKEALSMAPKSATSRTSMWLKHFFEFGRFVRSAEHRPGLRLDLYTNVENSYVEVSRSSFAVAMRGLVSHVLELGAAMVSELLKGVVDLPGPLNPAQELQGDETATIRLPFVSIIEADGFMKMYTRCMDVISHLVPEVFRAKALDNSCLMLDVMVNSLEFLLDKEHLIRRPAVLMLSRSLQSYVDTPCKAPARLVNVCGYRVCPEYGPLTAGVEPPFKKFDKSMRRFCAALLESNAPFPNVMFANQLFSQCDRDPVVMSMLLYACVLNGTSLQFNLDVLRRVSAALSTAHAVDAFGAALVAQLAFFKDCEVSTSAGLNTLVHFLLCFAASMAPIATFNLQGKPACLASTVCPAVFDAVRALFERLPAATDSSQPDTTEVRRLAGLCAAICTSTLSGGAFWALRQDAQSKFLESFDRVFPVLDAATRRLCLKFVTARYESEKFGARSLLNVVSMLHASGEQLTQQFVMGVVDNGVCALLPEVFSSLVQHEKTSKGFFQVSVLLFQRFVVSFDPRSAESLALLLKGSAALLDGVAKSPKLDDVLEQEAGDCESPMAHLSHVGVLIAQLYRSVVRWLGFLDTKSLHRLHFEVLSCLHALFQAYGKAAFDFMRPFLCNLCVVGAHLASTSDPAPETGSEDAASSEEKHAKSGPNACVRPGGAAAICNLLMQRLESDKGAETLLGFVELCTVVSDGNMAAAVAAAGSGGKSKLSARGKSRMDPASAYDEWLAHAIYSCICIGRLESSSPVVARCVHLLKASSDPVSILATLVFTAVASSFVEEPEFPAWIPRLDVRHLGLGKHLSNASKFELVHGVYAFVHRVLVAEPELLEIAIDAESFNNFKSQAYRRYKSVSLLLQGASLSAVFFKSTAQHGVLAMPSKKKRGSVGVLTPTVDEAGSADASSPQILKAAGEIGRMVYAANPRENHPRLVLGALSFFSGVSHAAASGNYWSADCSVDFAKQPWVCEYIITALAYVATSVGHKLGLSGPAPLSAEAAPFSRELSVVLGNFARVMVDFFLATDACLSSKRTEETTCALVGRCRKAAWRSLIGMCSGLSGPCASHCLALCTSRVELLLGQKQFTHLAVLDFVHALKLCIRLVSGGDARRDADVELIAGLARALAKLTARLVKCHGGNAGLSVCVLVLMLLLRRNFGQGTGDELLEAILNMLMFFTAQEPVDDRFALPKEKDIVADKHLSSACSHIFEELLHYNADKLANSVVAGSEEPAFSSAVPARVATLLSFYASVSCKYRSLLRLVLGLDFSQVLQAMRDGGRLLSLVSISLHYNRIKSKHVSDLERLYFLNVNLLSDFEMESLGPSHRKTRRAAKEAAASNDGESVATVDAATTDGNGHSAEPSSLRALYLDGAVKSPRLDLSCRVFSERPPKFGSDAGVKCFEDCAIVFALEYFSKIRSSDLADVLVGHISVVNKSRDKVHSLDRAQGAAEALPKDGTRLLLRIIVASLAEYGSVGATQFVLPRVYQFLNTVVDSTVDELGSVGGKQGKKAKGAQAGGSGGAASLTWKSIVNGVLALNAMKVCVETWDSKQASVPDMCLNTWLPTLGKALGAFDFLSGAGEAQEWERALEDTFLQLLISCSGHADRVEQVLSGDLVGRSEACKCRVLSILLSLWGKASFHLGGSVVNVMPVLGELADDESSEVQRLTELLNERIQSFLNME
ncbi:heat repeat-containing protein 1 [Babesia caballi]|uniref:Heat repeat-containing protein 1 n=1 Tax=Babesia caballi TaxID=5871 RepID=A0AAV4M0D2_BABCB|nr:heat repeat-containing protein 1 [Babesia caballi]